MSQNPPCSITVLILLFSICGKVTSINNFQTVLPNSTAETKNHDETDTVLIVPGKDLHYNLGVQILISIFLVIAYFDFIFQTVLLFYVFFQLAKTLRGKSEIFFAGLGITVFTVLRCTFILFFILPIPWDWAPNLSSLSVDICMYTNVTLFVFFFGFSSLTCAYYTIFVGTTGKRMVGSVIDPKTGLEPMVVVLMPIYNEEPDALFRAVESAIRCNYPANRLHVFLAFDEASETSLYFSLLKKLRVLSKEVSEEIRAKLKLIPENEGNSEFEIFPPRLEWYIEGVRVTICRFPHEGKSPTQGKSFRVINDLYGQQGNQEEFDAVANTLILFIDSDIILHENAIHNFVATAVKDPKIRGMTGLVTCRTSRNFNIFQYLQDAEYIDGQMFQRTCEASLGAVTCLPGALTLIRLSALQKVAPSYFIEIDKRRTVDFHRFHLGEDRYMTFLLTQDADGPYQVRFISSATCKTDAPDTFQKLLKQRRRWFLGGFVNDVSTMISPIMWKKVPLVVLLNTYFYSSRGLSWILPVMVISMIVQQSPGIALYIIVATFGVRYALLCLNALIMTRTKVCISYILLFFASPIFNWIVNLYAVITWNVRSWGGPRTDDEDGVVASKLDLINEVMAQKEGATGTTRKSLGQIKTMGRLIDNNLRTRNEEIAHFGSIRSTNSSKQYSNKTNEVPQVKKFVPFPYETEFLGGGDYDMSDSSIVIPPTPKLSISMSPTASVRSLKGFPSSPNFLSPQSNHNPSSLSVQLQHSHSMPDLHTLSQSNAPYLFAKLSPEIQRRASSFRLDTDYLAKVEGLATPENSSQRDTTFNRRLSGRSSPGGSQTQMGSREPSLLNFDIFCSNNSPTSGTSSVLGDRDYQMDLSPTADYGSGAVGFPDDFDDVVDIVIHVPDFNSMSLENRQN